MVNREWFRHTTWSSTDEADFRERLKRSRGSKAQYLRIQAYHLAEARTAPLYRAALKLLDEILEENPEPFELAATLSQRAQCLVGLGRREEAVAAYRASFDAQRALPNVHTADYLGFAELILLRAKPAQYEEALASLDEFGDAEPFPNQRFRSATARALLYDRLGDRRKASRWARQALLAAEQQESPFRHHRKLGVVASVARETERHLRELAGEVDAVSGRRHR
jgi:tetratricopeptide (TPR) repeat protein